MRSLISFLRSVAGVAKDARDLQQRSRRYTLLRDDRAAGKMFHAQKDVAMNFPSA